MVGLVFPGTYETSPALAKQPGLSSNVDEILQPHNIFSGLAYSHSDAGPLSFEGPVDVSHRTYAAAYEAGINSFIYNRIHVRPARLDLGNVVGTQVREIRVWNAYSVPKTLNELEAIDAEGITISGQPSPPFVVGPLRDLIWTVQVNVDGPPVVDARIIWYFDGEEPADLTITGNRITVWSFQPTWENGILERLEWKTDVITSPIGIEQRRSVRLSPRRNFQVKLIADQRERTLLELSVFNWGSRNWAIPIWPDVQQVVFGLAPGDMFIPCMTEHRDFRVGGLAMLRGKTAFQYEAVEIDTVEPTGLVLKRPVQSTWAVNTRLYPVRVARLVSQPTLTRLTDQNVTASAEFQLAETSDWPKIMPGTTYLGTPVFAAPPEESEELTNTYQRLLNIMDNDTSFPKVFDTATLAFTVQAHRWLMYGREKQAAMRSFWYAMAGRFKSVWVPTHYQDLVVTEVVAPTAQAIDVENVGYTRFGAGLPGRRDIMITMRNGTVYFRRIVGYSIISDDVERLSLDQSFGNITLNPSDFLRISFMARCRLEDDAIEIQHDTDSDGLAAARGVFRSLRDDI